MSTAMRRVLLVAHDRGGANLLLPLLARWLEAEPRIQASVLSTPMIEYEVSVLHPMVRLMSRATSMRREREGFWTYPENGLSAALRETRWDLVLTGTSLMSNLERSTWRLARELSIPCVAICDMWTEYVRRFTAGNGRILPDALLVLDERMEAQARAALGRSVAIKVVGSPHFARLITLARRRSQPGTKIRFISEPAAAIFPEAGVHEFTVAEMVIIALERLGLAADLLLRPHPQDDSEAWRRFTHAHRHRGVHLDDEPSWTCHLSTWMAVGLSSMMLIEFAVAGVPVASFHLPGSDESYYCLPEKELGIAVLRSERDLEDWFKDPSRPHVSREFIELHGPAIDRITALVLAGARVPVG